MLGEAAYDYLGISLIDVQLSLFDVIRVDLLIFDKYHLILL